MSNFYFSSVIGSCLATGALALAAACLGTTPARAAADRECYDILSEPTPEFQTYACGKLRDVDVAPRDAVVSGRLACDSAVGVQTHGDIVWVCQNPLSTVNRKTRLSPEQAKHPTWTPARSALGRFNSQPAPGCWKCSPTGHIRFTAKPRMVPPPMPAHFPRAMAIGRCGQAMVTPTAARMCFNRAMCGSQPVSSGQASGTAVHKRA
jgi:hypothetical protein